MLVEITVKATQYTVTTSDCTRLQKYHSENYLQDTIQETSTSVLNPGTKRAEIVQEYKTSLLYLVVNFINL